MTYFYTEGTVRWKRFTGKCDPRSYRPCKGWDAFMHLLDSNPITGRPLRSSQWWIEETYIGSQE